MKESLQYLLAARQIQSLKRLMLVLQLLVFPLHLEVLELHPSVNQDAAEIDLEREVQKKEI